MARKKGKTDGNNDALGKQDTAEVQPTEAEKSPEQQAVQQQVDTPVEELQIEELRAELKLARAEVERLKAELASTPERNVAPKRMAVSAPQELHELQEKLQRLRKEQFEADAARDKAWKQLKAVVQEISSLANPDYLQSLQVRSQD